VNYDLYITPKKFDAAAIREWFGWREHYEVSETQALYSNDDTGVYFLFDIVEEAAASDGEAAHDPHLAFNLNCGRPHVFGLEAEPEVSALLKAFDSQIEDPQEDGMGVGPYSAEGFLRGWNAGNRFGFRAMGAQGHPPPPWPADPAVIEGVWRWNFGRAALQNVAGGQVFVPRINWFLPDGSEAPVAACAWTERVPSLIPESLVTHIALVRKPRQSLMDKLGLSRGDHAKYELRLTGVRGVAHLPGMDRGQAHGLPVFYTPAEPTPDMNKLFSGVWPADAAIIIPTEQVCGADLVALMNAKDKS
jgi:hypothetical protein